MRARPERPAPVASDLDRHRLVAGRVERLDHRLRRRERDLVLARAPTHDDRDADPRHQGGTSRPTTIVTVVPGFAFLPPSGSCVRTSPSWFGSVVSWSCTSTLKPDCWSTCVAEASSWLVTSGTVVCFGPLETKSVTVPPRASEAPPRGSWSITVSFGWAESTSFRTTEKPAPWSAPAALSKSCPRTSGTWSGWSPFETLMCTIEPWFTICPPRGDWATTVPPGSLENTWSTLNFSLASTIAAIASLFDLPITSGTWASGGPLET